MAEKQHTFRVACPSCGQGQDIVREAGLNAGRFPHFRQQILDTRYGLTDCAACGTRFTVEAPFFYTDSGRRQWFACYPPQWETAWQQVVSEASEAVARAFDPASLPPLLRGLRERTQVRVVFGVPALREKLICEIAQIDDVSLEVFKLGLIQQSERLAPVLSHRPRCIDVGADGLVFLFHLDGEALSATIPRAEFTRVTERPEWDTLRETLGDSPYVDLGKLFHSGTERIASPTPAA